MAARRFPLLRDRAWMSEQVCAGRSNVDMAAELGCSVSSVVFAVSRLGLSGRRGLVKTGRQHRLLSDRGWLAERVLAGASRSDIASEANASPVSVQTWMLRHGLERPDPALLLADREWLEQRVESGNTLTAIGRAAGASTQRVRVALDQHGLVEVWQVARSRPVRHELADKGWLMTRLQAGASVSAIARELDCPRYAVDSAVKHFQLVVQSRASDDEKRTAVQRHVNGETVNAVARSTGRKAATVIKWVVEAGLEPSLRRNSAEEKRLIVERLRAGDAVSDLATTYRIDPTTVRAWRRAADKALAAGRDWP